MCATVGPFQSSDVQRGCCFVEHGNKSLIDFFTQVLEEDVTRCEVTVLTRCVKQCTGCGEVGTSLKYSSG